MAGQQTQPGPADIKAKKATIRAYFKHLEKTLNRAAELLDQQTFFFEAILVLYCHIGSYARLRFPKQLDHESYRRIVLEYSGQRQLFEKIDLLFLYQWPRSDFRNTKQYKRFKNYKKVKSILELHFGDENVITQERRFVSQDSIIKLVKNLPSFDMNNVRSSLPLFSLAEELYCFMRCPAVHNMRFPFWDKQGKGTHVLTKDKYTLLTTARNIHRNLKEECLQKVKFLFELP